jgi:mRNA interferase RelE/StbE
LAWRIEFAASAAKELGKLGKPAQKQITEYLRKRVLGSTHPRDLGKPLRKDLAGFWKYRVGDYRIIATIEEDRFLILVVRVGHRRQVYGGH